MSTIVSNRMARLRRRRQDINESRRKSYAAIINRYGKVVQQSFQQGLVSRAELVRKREERENRQQSMREQFAAATSNVLSQDTLAFLREQSNIAAPTLTSIFAGYESARADRAARAESVLDRRQEGLERIQAADELAFRDQAQARQQQLTAQGNILNSGIATQNALFASDNQGIATEAQFANTEIEQQFRGEESRRAREHAEALQKQRDKMALQRETENNKQALARLDKQIEKANAAAELAEQRRQAAANLAEQRRQASVTRTDTLARERAELEERRRQAGITRTDTLARERDETSFGRKKELIGLEHDNDVELIGERREADIAVRKTPTAAQSGAVAPNQSVLNQLRTGQFTRPADSNDTSDVTTTTTTSATPQGTPVTEDPVVEGGTEAVVTESAADNPVIEAAPAVVPETATEPEPTAVDNPAPGTPALPPQAEVSEDQVGEATQLLSSVLQQRDPDALANLGDEATLDQLATFFTDDEEDAEVLKALDTFRSINQTRVV